MIVINLLIVLAVLAGLISLSGFLYVWVTFGRGTFLRGLSKMSFWDVIQMFIEAKRTGENYPEVRKRVMVYFGVLIVCFFLGFFIAIRRVC